MLIYGASAFLLALLLTFLVGRLAKRLGVVDVPDNGRKKHARTVPLWGGLAIFVSFWAVLFYVNFNPIFGIELLRGKLFAAFIGSAILLCIGLLDDRFTLPAWVRFFVTALAVLVTIYAGLGLEKITNPLGGVIELDQGRLITSIGTFFLLANVITFFWLMGTMYTTKLLDGLDGLATGVATIGAIVIFILTTLTKFYQPNVALVSLIFACACLGFLVWNFSPASIFLGEGGSLFVGFMLGVLAIISGSKVATAFLVLAIPILDVVRVMYIRIKSKQSVFKGDRNHLHFTLVDAGFSERQVVFIFYASALVFGLTALFLQSIGKLIVLAALFLIMLYIAIRSKLSS